MYTLKYTYISIFPFSKGKSPTCSVTCSTGLWPRTGDTVVGRVLCLNPGSPSERCLPVKSRFPSSLTQWAWGSKVSSRSLFLSENPEQGISLSDPPLCLIIQITTIVLERVGCFSVLLLLFLLFLFYTLSHLLQEAFETSRPNWSLQWLKWITI